MYMFQDLTDRFPMKIDLERMRAELASLENSHWLSHYDKALAEGWTTIPLCTHDGSADNEESQRLGEWGKYKTTKYFDQLPYTKSVVEAFKAPMGRIRIMKLMPGSIIRTHRDTYEEVSDYSFGQVRLHIPIVTNEKVIFTVDGKNLHLKEGRLYYVNFSKKHYVRNDGTEARTHLVCDLQVNDELRKIFPPITPWQRVEMALTRKLVPLFFWMPSRLKREAVTAFWRYYNDSALRRLRHRLFPKHQRS